MLDKPVPGSKMSRIASSGFCRADIDRPSIMWADSSDATGWFYTTEETNPQQPPDKRNLRDQSEDIFKLHLPEQTVRVITMLKKTVAERQYPPATLMRRLISTDMDVHSPHRHVSPPFAFHNSLASFLGCWPQASQFLPTCVGKKLLTSTPQLGHFWQHFAEAGISLLTYAQVFKHTSPHLAIQDLWSLE